MTAAAVSARWVCSAHSSSCRSARARYANTAFVTAMNGTGSGTVSSGMPISSAAVISRSGARWWGSSAPRPSPTACTPAASSSAR